MTTDKRVPREPTQEMIEASPYLDDAELVAETWRAMWDAAPSAPEQDGAKLCERDALTEACIRRVNDRATDSRLSVGVREDFIRLVAHIEQLERDTLVREICEEWNEVCDCTERGVSRFVGHDGECKATNIAAAKRALREAKEAAEAEVARLREALTKVREWLASPLLDQWAYMEGTRFYEDKAAMLHAIDAARRTEP